MITSVLLNDRIDLGRAEISGARIAKFGTSQSYREKFQQNLDLELESKRKFVACVLGYGTKWTTFKIKIRE